MTSDDYKLLRKDMGRLREEVIRRVKTVRIIRAFLASPMSSALFAAMFISVATIFVSIADVVKNTMMYGEWSSRFSYTYTSILHTQAVVQVLAVLVVICGVMLVARLLLLSTRIPLRFWRS